MYDFFLCSRISIDFFQTFLLESHMLFNPTFFIDSKNVPSVCASVPLREQCKWLHKFSLGEQIGHSTALMLVHFSDALLLFTVESLSRKKNPIKPPQLLVVGSFFTWINYQTRISQCFWVLSDAFYSFSHFLFSLGEIGGYSKCAQGERKLSYNNSLRKTNFKVLKRNNWIFKKQCLDLGNCKFWS